MVGGGEGLLCGGGGLSGSSASSRGSSLICTGGTVEGPGQGVVIDAGRGMDMEEGGCCSADIELATEQGDSTGELPGMKE